MRRRRNERLAGAPEGEANSFARKRVLPAGSALRRGPASISGFAVGGGVGEGAQREKFGRAGEGSWERGE